MSNKGFNGAADNMGSLHGTERRLEGKVAIITGGAMGIGEAIVRLFTKHRARVIIADIADETGKVLAESLSPPAIYVHCDVSKEQDVSSAVDLAIEKYGQLDIMFNNAGTAPTALVKSVAEYEMEQFDRVMKVNVRGVMLGIKHAARVMIPRKKGTIISTGSVAGILGGGNSYSYAASKHAVIGLTKNGAAELGKYGIRVNIVSPYGVATPLAVQSLKMDDASSVEAFFGSLANLQGVTLKAEDIAEAALYLASNEAKYVSGHNLVVDGGITVVNHSWGLYSAGVQPCPRQNCTFLHAHSRLMQAHTRRQQVRLHFDLIVHSGQDKTPAILFMAHSILLSIICSSPSCHCSLQSKNFCSRWDATINVRLLGAIAARIKLSFSQAQLCSLNFARFPFKLSRIPSSVTCSATFSLRSLTMVRHRMRSRYGGSCGGRGRSQTAHSVDMPLAPASSPSSQANLPQPSTACKPFPHNTFKTTHFKFQSSLNKLIISASITIIFSKEEAQPNVTEHTSAEHSQGDHDSEQNMENEGNVIKRGDLHVEGNAPNDAQPPGGNSHGASVSVDIASSSSGNRRSSDHPSGSGVDDDAKASEFWSGKACPVVEEYLD